MPRKSVKMKNSKTKLYLLSLRILESRLGVVVMRAEIPSSIGGPVGRCSRARHWPHRVPTFLRQPKAMNNIIAKQICSFYFKTLNPNQK